MSGSYDALITVLSVSADAVLLLDERGVVRYANPAIEEVFGYAPGEVIGQDIALLQPEHLRSGHRAGLERHVRTGERRLDWRATETLGLHRSGRSFPIEIGFSRVEVEGRPMFAGFVRDITARKRAQEMLAGQKRILELVASGTPLETTFLEVTRWMESVFPGMLCTILLLDETGTRVKHGAAPSLPASFVAVIDGQPIGPAAGSCGTAAYRKELVVVKDIGIDPLWRDYREPALSLGLRACWSMPILSAAGEVLGTFAMYYREPRTPETGEIEAILGAASLTRIAIEKSHAERELARLAQFDTLTGLPNRTLFKDRLGQAVSRARREEWLTALAFIDLDGFKEINDTLGHAAGDEVLKAVGERLRLCVREGDTVARLGGDEFTVIFEDLKAKADVDTVAQKIQAAFLQPVQAAGEQLFIGASIGIALCPEDGADPDSLLKHADTAMYHAKGEGRNNYQLYSADMSSAASERMTLDASLRRGLERGELVLHYQPIVDVRSGAKVGAEALLRWNHPERGLIAPGQFISAAEQSGLIVPLGEWVIREACRQAAAWRAEGRAPLRISVNLSARQFRKGSVSAMLASCLRDNGLGGEHLMVEITESLLMENPQGSRRLLEEMRMMGVGIALDDFGTGYSSLSYLRHFPLDTVKIDRSFVRDLLSDPEDATIVRAIIDLGHNLRLKLTAEGVETQEQLDFLRVQGCDSAQGYFLGRPVPARELS